MKNVSWTFPGFHGHSLVFANLHEYWVERLPSFTDFRAAEVTIHFPCHSIAHYLICFRQLPAVEFRRLQIGCNANADVAATGATGDGHCEDDVHNSDADEQRRQAQQQRRRVLCLEGPASCTLFTSILCVPSSDGPGVYPCE